MEREDRTAGVVSAAADVGAWPVVGLLAALLALTGTTGGAAAQDTTALEGPRQEAREAIVLPEEARQTVLKEMRQMLEALNGVLRHAAARDRDAMKEAALSGGTRIAVDTDPAVAKRLPAEFIRLGQGTHEEFDALAEAIEAGIGRDSLFARLGGLTSKCVSCHASYRVVTQDGEK